MAKSRAVIDTNLFYYLAGVEQTDDLRADWVDVLQEDHFLSLASPTVVEVLTRQGIDEEDLLVCLECLLSDRFVDVVQIGYLPFDVAPLIAAVSHRDHEAIGQLRAFALERKLSCEVDFLRFVLYVLATAFLHVLLEDRRSTLTPEEEAELSRHFLALLESNAAHVREALHRRLQEGYAASGAKRLIEEAFQQLLLAVSHAALVSFHTVRAGVQLPDLPSEPNEVQVQIREAVRADPILHLLERQAKNPLGLLRKKQFREAVTQFVNELAADFEEQSTMPGAALAFFIERLRRDLVSGAKVRKNDVIDLLLAYSVVIEDTVFVTNDGDLIEGLKTASPRSYELCSALRTRAAGIESDDPHRERRPGHREGQ